VTSLQGEYFDLLVRLVAMACGAIVVGNGG